MKSIVSVLVCLTPFASSETRVPIIWPDQTPFTPGAVPSRLHVPHVEMTVEIPGGITVTNISALDAFGSPLFHIYDPSAFQHSQRNAIISLVGLTNTELFSWSQVTERVPLRTRYPIGPLDLSPHSPFLRVAHSFMITPTEFIINPTDPRIECEDPTSLTYVNGVFRSRDGDRWGFQVRDAIIFINSNDPAIALPIRDDIQFVAAVLDALNETSIDVNRNPRSTWYPRVINNCDMELLDEILPILDFAISDDFSIQITPKEYIRPYSGPGVDFNGCEINVLGAGYYGPKIGAGLFKRHAVLFDRSTQQLGICLART